MLIELATLLSNRLLISDYIYQQQGGILNDLLIETD